MYTQPLRNNSALHYDYSLGRVFFSSQNTIFLYALKYSYMRALYHPINSQEILIVLNCGCVPVSQTEKTLRKIHECTKMNYFDALQLCTVEHCVVSTQYVRWYNEHVMKQFIKHNGIYEILWDYLHRCTFIIRNILFTFGIFIFEYTKVEAVVWF